VSKGLGITRWDGVVRVLGLMSFDDFAVFMSARKRMRMDLGGAVDGLI
jgi:hypothetical protein